VHTETRPYRGVQYFGKKGIGSVSTREASVAVGPLEPGGDGKPGSYKHSAPLGDDERRRRRREIEAA